MGAYQRDYNPWAKLNIVNAKKKREEEEEKRCN